ncbi:MAG: 3-hydroxyacyl-CoA dehydrogenase NAD-binding domain-containing protein [Candidatus Freyarchaeota archaeon]
MLKIQEESEEIKNCGTNYRLLMVEMEDVDAKDVRKVVVVGAGVTGHSIAQVFAQHGVEVNLVDLDEKILQRAMKLMRSNLDTLVEFAVCLGMRFPRFWVVYILQRIWLLRRGMLISLWRLCMRLRT